MLKTSRQPFPKICVALGLPKIETLLDQAQQEFASGESFLEVRLDYLPSPERGVAAIRTILDKHPHCTIIGTCRRHHNSGRFEGSVERELAILNSAIDAGAHAVDVEIETAEAAAAATAALRDRAKLIVSWHNFESTPNLDPILRRLTRHSADAYKLAAAARKPSDVGRVLALAKKNPKLPLILLSMGEMGFPSRVLSVAYNGLFTYASPCSAAGTAAGQVSAQLLREQYRVDRLTKKCKLFCVVADPVGHSLSPAIHNRAFQTLRIDAVYFPMLVVTGQLRDFMKLAVEMELSGFSVTTPHKQRIVRYLDVVDSLARRIGAVNTVWRKAGKWRGSNTDAAAVIKPLEKRIRVRGSRVLIAGAGGAARAAAFALHDAGAQLTVTGRNPETIRMLARATGAEAISREAAEAGEFDALVHATPLGMYPKVKSCFFERRIPAELVFDMVYNPLETLLLQRAKEQGSAVIPGMEMFIEQAVAQFELWTGETAPRAAMERAAIGALEQQNSVPGCDLK